MIICQNFFFFFFDQKKISRIFFSGIFFKTIDRTKKYNSLKTNFSFFLLKNNIFEKVFKIYVKIKN